MGRVVSGWSCLSVVLGVAGAIAAGCGGGGGAHPAGTGGMGTSGTGGAVVPGTGGAVASGTGGMVALGTGGASGTGGAVASGTGGAVSPGTGGLATGSGGAAPPTPDGGGDTPTTEGSAAGTWTGSLQSPGAIPVGVRFIIDDQSGQLTGRTYFQDDVSSLDYLPEAAFTGARSGGSATWMTEGDLAIAGTFTGDDFAGTIAFPADEGHPSHVASLTLHR